MIDIRLRRRVENRRAGRRYHHKWTRFDPIPATAPAKLWSPWANFRTWFLRVVLGYTGDL